MRLAPLLAATALALVAAGAVAQEEPPPDGNGLSGLSDTLNGLSDENAQAGAQPPAEEPPVVENEIAPTEPQPRPEAQPPVPEARPEPTPPPVAARPPLAMPPAPLTRAQLAELRAAATRGRLLGMIDEVGRAATQDMLSRIADPDGAGIAGWFAEAEGNGTSVTFYAESEAGPVTVYRVTFNGGRIVNRGTYLAGPRPPLNPIQARMAQARSIAARQDHRPCAGDQFNYFVVPPLTPDGPVDVYQITPRTRPGFYPFGGHFRTSIAADGSILATRGYTSACLDVAVAGPPPGGRPAPLSVTHLLDPLPQDIHAFLSAWTGHPLIVVAGDPQRLFAVTPEGIGEIPRQGPGR